ncbi:MAG: hypothetical protein KKI09_06540 [Spirochaetes bacterium]|nr:hypothetical protein [Spirochaetota bacterium]
MEIINSVYDTIKLLPDYHIQRLLRLSKVEDMLVLMQQDVAVAEVVKRNVKMTTRLWLQAELDKTPNPEAERLAAAEKAIKAILTDLDNNPPEFF